MGRLVLQSVRALTRPLGRGRAVKRRLSVWLITQRRQQTTRSKSTLSENPSSTPSAQAPQRSDSKASIAVHDSNWLWHQFQTGVQPLTYPIRAYNRAQNKRPYITQILSSLVIYFLGDLSSQYLEQPPTPASGSSSVSPQTESVPASSSSSTSTTSSSANSPQRTYEPIRSLRALIIGGTFSLPSYHWFLFLSHNFNIPRRPAATLALKIIINQLVFSPLFNIYFFGMQSLLSAESPQPDAAWKRIKETVPTSWFTSWKFWPLVTAFSFTFIRPQSRSVFGGVVAIGWQSYLGLVNQRAVRKKGREEEEEASRRSNPAAA